MSILNARYCPICGTELKDEMICDDYNDAIIAVCIDCGKFAMSREFYEDHVEPELMDTNRAKLAIFLAKHKQDKLRPFFSQNWGPVADGFKNYPYHICILGTILDK